MLVEAAWAYRFRARVSRALLQRQEGLPQAIRDMAGRAQVQLRALPTPVGQGQDQSGRHYHHRKRAVQLYLGNCHCCRWANGLMSAQGYQRATIGKRRAPQN
jgi:hypothetical protein